MMARGRGLTRSVEAERPGMIGRFMPRAANPKVITITKDKINDFVRKLLYKKHLYFFCPPVESPKKIRRIFNLLK